MTTASRSFPKFSLDTIIKLSSALIAILYIYLGYQGQLPVFQQRGILVGFCFVIIFITTPMIKGKRTWWTTIIDAALIIATITSISEVIRIEVQTPPTGYYLPRTYDIILAAGLVIAVLEAGRRVMGPVLPILCIVAIVYAVWGNTLPGLFSHTPLKLSFIFYYLSITVEGIWGLPTYVVTSVVILFLILSSLMQQCGLMEFFVDLSNALIGKYRGGPAKIAVIASGGLATMSGSAVANVAATGSFTIPLMKNVGYLPDFAGAVESAASTGGVITPPVMGAAAFIIAEYLGMQYWAICAAAIIPSLLYYVGVYTGVDLEAMKNNLGGLPKDRIPNLWKILLRQGYLLLPIFVLVYFLGMVKSSAMMASFWAIISVLLLAMIRKETRQRILGWGLVEGLAEGLTLAKIAVTACTSAGIVVGVLVVTGLAFRLNLLLIELAGGNVVLLLVFAAIVSLILGMGMTTTSVYLLMAIVVAPALTKLGISPLAAHLFVFYFGNLSHITPPVCISCYVAAGISKGKPFAIALQTCKLGAVIFIIPFFFSFQPALIMQGTPLTIIVSVGTAIVGVVTLAFAFANYSWLGRLNVIQRIILFLAGLALIFPHFIASAIGGIALVIIMISQYLLRKKENQMDRRIG